MSEFFIYVLQQLEDAYVDLRPWLLEIGFSSSKLIQSKVVVNTDPGTSPSGTAGTEQMGRGVWKCCRTDTRQGMNAGPPRPALPSAPGCRPGAVFLLENESWSPVVQVQPRAL